MNLKISEKFRDLKHKLEESRYRIYSNELFDELCYLHDYIVTSKDKESKNEFVEILHDLLIELFMPLREETYKHYPEGVRFYFGSNVVLHDTIQYIFDLNIYSKIWMKDLSEFYKVFSTNFPQYNAVPKTDFSKLKEKVYVHTIKDPGLIRSMILDHLKIHVDPDKPTAPNNSNPLDHYIYQFENALYEESKIKNRFFQNMKYKEFHELQNEHTALLHLKCIAVNQEEIYDEEEETISWIIKLIPQNNNHLYKYPLFKDNPCVYVYAYKNNLENFNPIKSNYLGKKVHIDEEENSISIRISKPLRESENISFALVLRPDYITYSRERNALKHFKEKSEKDLQNALVLKQKSPLVTPIQINTFYGLDLNITQRKAVEQALCSKNLFCIHGPPGTGKTRVCAEILVQYLNLNPLCRVLVTCASNEAADNLLHAFKKVLPPELHQYILHIGEDKQSIYSLNCKIKHSQDYVEKISSLQKQSDEIAQKVLALKTTRKQKELIRLQLHHAEQKLNAQFQQDTAIEGLFDEKDRIDKEMQQVILELIDLRYAIQREEKKEWELKQQISSNREELKRSFITAKPLFIFSTNNHSDVLRKFKVHFDLLVIDEVTQSTEPSVLIPLSQSSKLIMAGDHHQLPPTVFLKNKNYDDNLDPLEEKNRIQSYQILSRSIFERLYGHLDCIFLDRQYRMNPLLVDFLNKTIYAKSNLVCDSLVNQYTYHNSVFNSPLIFINHNTPEIKSYVSEEFSPSKAEYHNPEEINLIEKLVKKYLNSGILASDIGVISPYNAQIRELNKVLEPLNILAKTIDSFQGQEKKIIILSLVRSNQSGEATQRLGFLVDERRFNVAITRFQYELIIVGNEETLSSYEQYYDIYDDKIKPIYYKSLIAYIKEKGLYVDNLAPYLTKKATFEHSADKEINSHINYSLQQELVKKMQIR